MTLHRIIMEKRTTIVCDGCGVIHQTEKHQDDRMEHLEMLSFILKHFEEYPDHAIAVYNTNDMGYCSDEGKERLEKVFERRRNGDVSLQSV